MTKMTPSTTRPCSSHRKGISSRRRSCSTALAFSILNVLLSFAVAGPVFSKNFQVAHHIQAGRNIRHLPCKIKRSGEEGVCMFAIDCLKSNGTHLGTCIDRFYFGSCCQIKDDRNVYLDHEINDNSIDGLLSNLVPAASTTSSASAAKLPNGNNYSHHSPNKTSSGGGSDNDRVTTSRTPAGESSSVFLTDEFPRKTTTKRPSSSSSASSLSTKRPTTTTASTSSTNFEMISVSSGVLHNNPKNPSSNHGTTVFATLSTKLPTTVSSSSSASTGQSGDKTTGFQSTSSPAASNKPSRVPLEPTASTASSKNDGQQLDAMTTSPMKLLEFTTFQSVNSHHTAVITTTTTKRPTAPTVSRKPIPVITKRPVTTKYPFVTSTTKFPPRRTPGTKRPSVPLQDPIFPQRLPPVLQNQIKSNATVPTTTTTTRRPVSTLADNDLIQISISPPKATTKKPLPITKKPVVTTTTPKRPTKPVVQKVPLTTAATAKPTTTTKKTTTTTSTTVSPAEEAFTTISYVESTRAPRPKPKPTAAIELVTGTGWEDDLITVEEGDEELSVTTSSPLTKEDAATAATTGEDGGERRTTTQKPVKLTTSVKVEPTTSTTTTSTTTVAPITTTTTTAAPTTTTPVPVTTTTTTTSTTPEPATTTTTSTSPSTTTTTTTTTTTPEPTTTSSTAAPTTTAAPITEKPKPLLDEETSSGGDVTPSQGDEDEEGEMTTLSEGIVTWTTMDVEEDDQKTTTTTEDPSTSQWVPLLTISSEDAKNASTPITSSDRTTTPMTPTAAPLPGTDGNATVTDQEATTTTATPTHVSTDADDDDKAEITTIETSVFSNETTTLSPADADGSSANSTTPRPSFPSLEGIDYRMICGKRMFPEPRIVGGAMASFGRWPWQISLRQWRTSTYLHKCGAALLNENWAITAAHCVDNVPPSDLLLRLGEFDLAEEDEPYGYQERRVQIVASHPQFDPRTFEYDLALLRFYEPVVFQPNIIPICVPETDENFIGRTAFVTGWGRLYEDGPLPSKLQEVSVPVIENKICETMYRSAGYIEHIPHIFICAGWKKGGYDSCEGDSGGPMVIQRDDKRFQLAGVISWGIGCAEPDQPGVYTRISEFRDWINQILQF